MNTREYHDLFSHLMEQCCFYPPEIIYVNNIAEWCRDYGLYEPDMRKPIKLIPAEGRGFRMLINEFVSDEVIEQRVNALSIRSQLRNASSDRAGLLNSDKKKLAFLFLFELASNNPDLPDERSSDAWVFQEMGRLGFFRE